MPVLYSLGNYLFHQEFSPIGFDKSTFHVPYTPPSLPENHQSCIAEIVLVPDSNGLSIEKLIIHPGMLDEIGEPVEGTEEQKRTIAGRLHHFSQQRGVHTELIDQTVVWQSKIGFR